MEQNEKHLLYEKMLKYTTDMLCAINENGVVVSVNEASHNLLGYECDKLEGKAFISTVHPEDVSCILEALRNKVPDKLSTLTCQHIHKNGEVKSIFWSIRWSEEDKMFFCTAHDTTSDGFHSRDSAEKEELYMAMMRHGADMMGVIDIDGKYLYVGGSTSKILGYSPEQLVGVNAFSLIHPEDVSKVEESWSEVNSKELIYPAEFRFKAANGEWKWIETVVSNQLHNPVIQGFVVSSRDITEKKVIKLRLQESEQRYRALFDNNPDVIFLESTDGKITEVNQAFEEVFGLSTDDVTGKTASLFLPDEMLFVNKLSLQQALLGSTVRSDITITTKEGKLIVFDSMKFPVTVNSEIVGIQTIAKDITPIVRSYEVIEQQAKKLNSILESITEAFFALDKNFRFTYANSVLANLIEYGKEELIGKKIYEQFPIITSTLFYSKCKEVITNKVSAHFEDTSPVSGLTYRFKIYPWADGVSVYFTDTTKEREMQRELEKLSLVASKTDNGVVITDANGLTEWVNESFTRITGYTLDEMQGKKPGDVLQGPETDENTVHQIRTDLRQHIPFHVEIINYKKSGEKFWVSMDITPIHDDEGRLTQYIAIQRDITSRKNAEANLLKITDDLFAHNRDMQEFTYIVSHNLRAPVANALGLANLMIKMDKTSKAFELSLEHLQTSVVKIDTVLKDVNVILSVRERQGVHEREEVRLVDLVNRSLSHLQESFVKFGVEVIVAIEENITVSTNRAYLHSVFYNLLTNAIKFRSQERTPIIRIQHINDSSNYTTILVADNGIGFNVEKAGDKLFRLYKQFHKNREGRGVGLFLVKKYIKALGGHVEVSSQVSKGTTFTIRLLKHG